MTPREEFAAALEQLRSAEAEARKLYSPDHPLTVAFHEEVIAAAKVSRKKGQRVVNDFDTACKVLPSEKLQAIKTKLQPEADRLYAERQAAVEAAAKLVKAAALRCTPEPGDQWVELDRIHPGSYSTQGFGAETYAKNAAEMTADMARQYGNIEVRIREEFKPEDNQPRAYSGPFGSTYRLGYYIVEAKVREKLDEEIINRGRSPSLREQIKMAWARGVNPRVYNPYLPYGIEAKLGLDEFGHDLPGWKADGEAQG
jgi:hypothetical protein